MNNCLFLDRDGVINEDIPYLYKIKEFKFRNEIFSICKEALKNKFIIIVITNQAGIGRGKYSLLDFYKLNKYMIIEFRKKGIEIKDTFFCPYHPVFGKGKYLKDSFDRKPNPGMILKAVKKYSINIQKSIFIGNNESDYEASFNAGLKYYVDANSENWSQKAINIIQLI